MPTTLEQLRLAHPDLSDDAIADLASISLQMSRNKKTRRGFLGLIKEVSPETPIPEIDEVQAVQADLAKRDERIEKLEKSIQDRDFSASLAAQKQEARAKYSLTDEDFKKMEEMMTKGDLPADYRFAPALYKQQTEPATPTNYGTGGYGPLDLNRAAAEKGFEGLMDDPDNWSLRTAHAMVDDIQRKGRTSAF